MAEYVIGISDNFHPDTSTMATIVIKDENMVEIGCVFIGFAGEQHQIACTAMSLPYMQQAGLILEACKLLDSYFDDEVETYHKACVEV